MKQNLLEYLVCPACQVSLECHIVAKNQNDIETGHLNCSPCQTNYPIVRGIPRFVTTNYPLEGDNIDTVDSFGWQWQKFNELHDMDSYKVQFLDWIEPITPDFFQGKVVLDAGCGMGRFSMVSSDFGAKMVLAIDASDAVEVVPHNAQNFPNVHVIQADIHNLPLRHGREAQIDFAFSIGVLHHLDNPQAGFTDLTQHLHPNGTIFAWIYGRENNGWLVNIVNPVRTIFTSRLPGNLLYALSWLITIFLHPLLKLIYRPINSISAPGWLRKILPYNDYLAWLGQFQFHHNHHVIFDHLSAPVAFYIRRETFERWFQEADLEIINLSWRNQNSWRGHGRLINAHIHKNATLRAEKKHLP